jgi:GT2 family glycosyltransferase
MQAEIIVVDNHSTDGSLAYLKPKFTGITFIENKENTGFAKACNQGWRSSSGEYILFLNPDTIVPENCFEKCISFFESQPDAGALGIKMLDGSGKFLKESKRAFPDPLTSMYKLFGFARLFPRSRTFSKYHLGHLDEKETNQIDVLAGAFMMIRKEVLDKTGGFDETFFMYGEDVDLSYRMQKAGYKNYYFAGSQIIHFKGESTRKGSMNYVRMFYQAMSIFVKKHYGGSKAGIFNLAIHIAIWFRAGLSAVTNFIRRFGLPLLDAGLILLSFLLIKNFWSAYIKKNIHYDPGLLWIAFPAYTVFFLIAAYYAGLYDRWYIKRPLFRSMLFATILLLAAYSLLPEQYRFSRGIILFGAVLAFIFLSLLRSILIRMNVLTSYENKLTDTNTVVAGTPEEYKQVIQLLNEAGMEERVLGRISVSDQDLPAMGELKQLKALSATIPFREIIFCKGTLSFKDIIDQFTILPAHVVAKIHTTGSSSIVGSNESNTIGESLSKENGFKLGDPYNRRIKRLIDILVSITGIITFPLHIFFVKKPFHFLANCIAVLFARKTWIGYAIEQPSLPELKKAVIANNGWPVSVPQTVSQEGVSMMDYWYARDYEPFNDLKLIWKSYRNLGS